MKLRGPVGWLNLLLDGVFVFFSTHTLKNWGKWLAYIFWRWVGSTISVEFWFVWFQMVGVYLLTASYMMCVFVFSCSLRDPANWWGKFIEIWFWLAVYASICMVLFTLDILGGATCTISVWYFWLYILPSSSSSLYIWNQGSQLPIYYIGN